MKIDLVLKDGTVVPLQHVTWWRVSTHKEDSCDVEVKTWGNTPTVTRDVVLVKDDGDIDTAHVDTGFFNKYVWGLRDY